MTGLIETSWGQIRKVGDTSDQPTSAIKIDDKNRKEMAVTIYPTRKYTTA